MKAHVEIAIRRVLNFALYLSLCFVLGTGLLLDFRLPHGPQGRGLAVLGLTRHEWGDWHTWVGYALGVLIVIHLILARKWLMLVAAKRRALWLWVGLAAGIMMIVSMLFAPVGAAAANRGEGASHEQQTH